MPEDPVDHFENLKSRHVQPQALHEAEEAILTHGTRAEARHIIHSYMYSMSK